MPTIVIAAGGTAGHVVPALAVAAALRDSGARVEFLGGERAEAELVPVAGYPFHELRVAGIDRRNPLRAARAVGLALTATVRARRLLKQLGADAVMGGGGYVAAPVGVAARSLGLPVVATEADSHLGITNRLLARFAHRVFLAFPIRGTRRRALPAGRPPEPGRNGSRRPLPTPASASGSPPAARCLLVFGGSLGARRINDAALEAFGSHARLRRAARVRAPGPPGAGRAPGGARLAAALPPARLHRAVRRGAGRRRPGGRPLRRLGAGGRRRRSAVDPRALPARHRRPPDAERPSHGARGRRGGGARRRAGRSAAGP
ncbi:MAG: glycosyltransferase [Thermoleophilaceae bacterium]